MAMDTVVPVPPAVETVVVVERDVPEAALVDFVPDAVDATEPPHALRRTQVLASVETTRAQRKPVILEDSYCASYDSIEWRQPFATRLLLRPPEMHICLLISELCFRPAQSLSLRLCPGHDVAAEANAVLILYVCSNRIRISFLNISEAPDHLRPRICHVVGAPAGQSFRSEPFV